MRLRIADRVLAALTGLLLLAACAGSVAQMFFHVDVVGAAVRLFNSESLRAKVLLIALTLFLLFLGLYFLMMLFRHRKRRDRFFLQRNEEGELAISLKAMEQMVRKCLENHDELEIQRIDLENRKDGMLVRVRGKAAGGISIPLTVESLQRQIRQYVTACSGIEIRSIRVEIEESGKEATDAPFLIEVPSVHPLLKDSTEKRLPVHTQEQRKETAPEETGPAAEKGAPVSVPEPTPAMHDAKIEVPDEDDDRPLHQRLFSTVQEPCIIPSPPQQEPEDLDINQIPQSPEQEASSDDNSDDGAQESKKDSCLENDVSSAGTGESVITNPTPEEEEDAESALSDTLNTIDRFGNDETREEEHDEPV